MVHGFTQHTIQPHGWDIVRESVHLSPSRCLKVSQSIDQHHLLLSRNDVKYRQVRASRPDKRQDLPSSSFAGSPSHQTYSVR